MTMNRMADLIARLMTGILGYPCFGAQGGDIGSGVTESLGAHHHDAVVGIHLTDVPYRLLMTLPPEDLSDAEKEYMAKGKQWAMEQGGYATVQSTKPQTLAYGLNDSPAGLAAWIIEPFRLWSDCNGDIESRFSKDDLLTNITIYWATETIHSSTRVYWESNHEKQGTPQRLEVPAGFALFPKDLIQAPREFAERSFNIQRWSEMPQGGHFAALEEPELLAEEIRAFFRPLR